MSSSERARAWLAALLRGESPPWPADDPAFEPDTWWNLADKEGVLPLCYQALSQAALVSRPPEELLTRLVHLQRHLGVAEILREEELKRVLTHLAGAGIHPLLMKGSALAYTHYPAPHLRPRCDSDLLFRDRIEAERAFELLRPLGYERPSALSGEQISRQFTCYRADPHRAVSALDCHWRINNRELFAQALEFDELTAASVEVRLEDRTLLGRGLGPEHALLLACMHRIGHAAEGTGNRLIWLYDIHLLANGLDDDGWARLKGQAIAKELRNVTLDGLRRTRATYGTVIPESFEKELEREAEQEAWYRNRQRSRAAIEWMDFRALPGLGERLSFLREHLLPPREYIYRKYQTRNPLLLPLLYLHRALRGMGKLFR